MDLLTPSSPPIPSAVFFIIFSVIVVHLFAVLTAGACSSRRRRCRGVDDGVIRSCKLLIVVSFFKRLSLYHFALNLSLPLTAFPSRSIRLLNEESVGAVTAAWMVGSGGGFNASI